MILRSRSLPLALGIAVTLTVAGTAGAGVAAGTHDSANGNFPLKVAGFLGEQRLPNAAQFEGTTVGGFSGLDYDPDAGTWFIVSDDRSALQPARFYTADLDFEGPDGALSAVTLTGTRPFLRPDGAVYPPLQGGDGTTVDPEDIRVDPKSDRLLWSQEGERIVPTDGTPPTLINPTVRFAERDGGFVSELPLPDGMGAEAGERGIRQNFGPEGLTFADDGDLVVTALEGPLLQDGPPATRTTGALSRIVVQERDGDVTAQYAYPQEPVFADPVPAGGFTSTGVTAILAIDDDARRFLVMERSFVTGVGNRVQIYEVRIDNATNIADGTPIAQAKPVKKRLLVDVSTLPVQSVDNIEGMAWGPERADGSRTLVLVSDDNFSATQVTQFVALAVR